MKRTLRDYLDELRRCDDFARLEDELNVRDNYFVLLYGNREDLFSRVTQAFRDSPQEDGLRDSWEFYWQRDDGMVQAFNYEPGTVMVQVWNDSGRTEDEHKINGQVPAIELSFHPSQRKEMEGVTPAKAMALAIVDFGDYVMREGLTARFTKNALDLNYVPE